MTAAQPKNVFEWSQAYFRSEDRSLHETKATMAALMTYADFDRLTCYPSQQTLAKITGLHVTTVRRHIKANVEAGWLTKLKQGSSYKSATLYQLTVPTPGTGAGSPSEDSLHGHRELQDQPPARVHRVKPTHSTHARSTPSTDAWSTPCMDACLTTHTTNQGTTHQGGSIETTDPFRVGGYVPGQPQPSITTPSTDARSSVGVGAWSSPDSSAESGDSGDPRDPFSSAYVPPARWQPSH